MKTSLLLRAVLVPMAGLLLLMSPPARGDEQIQEVVDGYKKSDQAMAAVYEQLMKTLKAAAAEDDLLEAWPKALLESQRAWITWRDTTAHFEALSENDGMLGGSIHTLHFALARTELTEERAEYLRKRLAALQR